jgi:hypothetical protein
MNKENIILMIITNSWYVQLKVTEKLVGQTGNVIQIWMMDGWMKRCKN